MRITVKCIGMLGVRIFTVKIWEVSGMTMSMMPILYRPCKARWYAPVLFRHSVDEQDKVERTIANLDSESEESMVSNPPHTGFSRE